MHAAGTGRKSLRPALWRLFDGVVHMADRPELARSPIETVERFVARPRDRGRRKVKVARATVGDLSAAASLRAKPAGRRELLAVTSPPHWRRPWARHSAERRRDPAPVRRHDEAGTCSEAISSRASIRQAWHPPAGALRPSARECAYIFGAICLAKGKGVGLVMRWCDTDRPGGAPHRDQLRAAARNR